MAKIRQKRTVNKNSEDWRFSIVESLNYGFAKTKKFLWTTLGLCVLAGAAQFVSLIGILLIGSAMNSNLGWLVIFVITPVLLVYVSIMILLGWQRVALAVLSGRAPALAHFLDTDNHQYFWQYIGASILYKLIISAGTILLVIPGIVWAYTYAFAGLLVVDKKLSPAQALAASRELVAGQRLNLFVWSLALAGINIVGALCLGIGLLITVPTTYFASVYVYGKLSGKSAA